MVMLVTLLPTYKMNNNYDNVSYKNSNNKGSQSSYNSKQNANNSTFNGSTNLFLTLKITFDKKNYLWCIQAWWGK